MEVEKVLEKVRYNWDRRHIDLHMKGGNLIEIKFDADVYAELKVDVPDGGNSYGDYGEIETYRGYVLQKIDMIEIDCEGNNCEEQEHTRVILYFYERVGGLVDKVEINAKCYHNGYYPMSSEIRKNGEIVMNF